MIRTLALALSALILSAGPGLAQDVSEVSVTARAPTLVRIAVAGQSPEAVRQQVATAARTVCRNAVTNSELDLGDLQWCRQRSRAKALSRYAHMQTEAVLAAERTILVLAAR